MSKDEGRVGNPLPPGGTGLQAVNRTTDTNAYAYLIGTAPFPRFSSLGDTMATL